MFGWGQRTRRSSFVTRGLGSAYHTEREDARIAALAAALTLSETLATA